MHIILISVQACTPKLLNLAILAHDESQTVVVSQGQEKSAKTVAPSVVPPLASLAQLMVKGPNNSPHLEVRVWFLSVSLKGHDVDHGR